MLKTELQRVVLATYKLDETQYEAKLFEGTFPDFLVSDKSFMEYKDLSNAPTIIIKNKAGDVFQATAYLGFPSTQGNLGTQELFELIPNDVRAVIKKVLWFIPSNKGIVLSDKMRSVVYEALRIENEPLPEPLISYTNMELNEEATKSEDNILLDLPKFNVWYDLNITPFKNPGMLDFETANTGFKTVTDYGKSEQYPLLAVVNEQGILSDLLTEPRVRTHDEHVEALAKFADQLRIASEPYDVLYTYNKTFEIKQLEKLGLEDLIPKVRDLADPFRSKIIYYANQNNKWSLKFTHQLFMAKNLYADLNIPNGSIALTLARSAIYKNEPDVEFINDLVEYCKVDTMIMFNYLDYYKTIYEKNQNKQES